MTIDEAIEFGNMWLQINEDCKDSSTYTFFQMAIKSLEQESCETIKEIPKDYKYDTETENFLVYRHKYTGYEIHIEKPVPRYKLEQEPCEDCVSRQTAIDELELQAKEMSQWSERYTEQAKGVLTAKNIIKDLPSVTPQSKTGKWIKEKSLNGWDSYSYQCSICGRSIHLDTEIETLADYPYCHCGAKMEEVEE